MIFEYKVFQVSKMRRKILRETRETFKDTKVPLQWIARDLHAQKKKRQSSWSSLFSFSISMELCILNFWLKVSSYVKKFVRRDQNCDDTICDSFIMKKSHDCSSTTSLLSRPGSLRFLFIPAIEIRAENDIKNVKGITRWYI